MVLANGGSSATSAAESFKNFGGLNEQRMPNIAAPPKFVQPTGPAVNSGTD